MSSWLDRLAGPNGALVREEPTGDEFTALVQSGLRRLEDADHRAISLEGRFDLVYNAAHVLCLAALRYRGYRARNRHVVFQALPLTLSLGPEVWRVLAKGHEIRNMREYEGEFDLTEGLVADMITAARVVATSLASLPPLP